MKTITLIFLIGIFIFIPYVSYGDEEIYTLAKENNAFAFDLYKKLSSQYANDNLFFSPFNITSALFMTYVGAGGLTKEEMRKTLHIPYSDEILHKTFGEILKKIKKGGKGYIIEVANALWGDKGYTFLKNFVNTIKIYYNGAFYTVDFKGDPEGSREKINKWVEKKTREKIVNLLPKGSITPLTRLVITSAIYFKGKWQSPFDKEYTEEANFYPTREIKVSVPMMFQEGKFKYEEIQEKYQIISLPYGNGDLSMVIILPLRKDGLSEVERALTWDEISTFLSSSTKSRVKVYLPKFKVERSYELKKSLLSMGMESAFTHSADFSKMEPHKELYISNVVHKAYIDVNEEGTEAAAATGVVIVMKSMPIRPLIFRADHPFLYLIVHNPTKEILFMGKVVDPTK